MQCRGNQPLRSIRILVYFTRFEALKAHAEMWKSLYTESTFWFDLGYVVFAILMAATVLLVLNLIMKLNVMKDEKRLIGSRKEVEA